MGEVEGSKQTSLGTSRIAIVGYGPLAREQALRLRLHGHDVVVALRPGGMSWVRAIADGLRPLAVGDAVAQSQVVIVHAPETELPTLLARVLAPRLAPGALLVFTRATALFAADLQIDPRVDVVLATTREPPWHVAVHTDATGRALERAIELARAAIGAMQVGSTTVAAELRAEIAELAERKGGVGALREECDRYLDHPAHEPDEATVAYYERLRALIDESTSPPVSATLAVTTAYRRRQRGAA